MKNMEKKRRLSGNAVTLLMTAVIAAVCAGMLYSGAASRQMSSMLVSMTCYIAMAVSLNLVVGLLGELSLGHAGFMSAGLFTGCLFSLATADSLPLIVRLPAAMLIGGLAAALVGLIVGLPALRLTPDPKTGNCRFFEGSACTIHAARPLACALYPLGQSIDTVTAQTEYYVQTPLCGARAGEARTLQDYLQDSAVLDRAGVDARWAIVCTQLSHRLQAAGGADNPRFSAAVRRMERALYYDYELGDDFYPQFCQNIEILMPLLDRML